ncbi:thioredoxin family protein [Lederbergia lenta]|uniref:Thioredoxin domain-containing protein n=1 Tax=Lederbergia lenta TaxID=1467 RepID=A0A2X4WAC5_LEDLE|nr:thioredoxin family protein [Lederbergia lenta]MCM3112969.1 thioredoxin family protein [Lederbergia lenta]MEC2326641.1 thioredoxin family protein [Lederbergia lenta]SQI61627.1 Thioredoxin domain-containing protein [Lederbergia lenta]
MKEWSKEDINEVLKKEGVTVLYFYTPLCGTCQVAGKMISIVEHLVDEIPFGKADLNYFPKLAEYFSIESVPCLLIIKDGQVYEKVYAFKSVPDLLTLIQKYIND